MQKLRDLLQKIPNVKGSVFKPRISLNIIAIIALHALRIARNSTFPISASGFIQLQTVQFLCQHKLADCSHLEEEEEAIEKEGGGAATEEKDL